MSFRYKNTPLRYKFEYKDYLRQALLAAKDGHDAKKILKDLFTEDEQIRLGKRIAVAGSLMSEFSYEEISKTYGVGYSTINLVNNKLRNGGDGFKIIIKREKKEFKEYKSKGFIKRGGSKLLHKYTEKTGFTKLDVER